MNGQQLTVDVQIPCRHSVKRVALRPSLRPFRHLLPQFGIGNQSRKRLLPGVSIVRTDIQRRLAPHFAQAANIPQHQRAPRKRGFQRGQSERLIAGRQSINGGAGIPIGQFFRQAMRRADES